MSTSSTAIHSLDDRETVEQVADQTRDTVMHSLDGCEAVAQIAYQTSDICVIFPISPASPMGEAVDKWMAEGKTNFWGSVPDVVEMQSEGGAVGAVHGALQTGSLATTFTASQGLLLMIPNMYKIAGELTPAVFHVAARTIATHALSIFGDHSDVMAVRQTGFALCASSSVQEAHDFALICQATTLECRVPFLHFFDGYRTSHEINKIATLGTEEIDAMLSEDLVAAHRHRALSPEHPVVRGTSQNPDVFFQSREAINPFYARVPEALETVMARFAELTGRRYELFEYYGAPDAERVIVIMASAVETAVETCAHMQEAGEKVGVIKVRLFRPFSVKHLLEKLPATVKKIAVLDRTKEPGAAGEPLYKDVVTALCEAAMDDTLPMGSLPRVVGGRYGLSSKEFTPAMVKGIFDELTKPEPKKQFTIGINDDVSCTSLDYDPTYIIGHSSVFQGIFFGLGSDGTVSANKNSIKIIGEETDNHTQGYFVYDSKKAGSQTISHLRFGPDAINWPYLIQKAGFVACHQFDFITKTDILKRIVDGGTFLLNSPYGPDEVWDHLPDRMQHQIISKNLNFYCIDATKVAKEAGMGGRINTVLQTCFFAIAEILPRDEAIDKIKQATRKSFGHKGEDVVQKNFAAVDQSLANLHKIEIPDEVTGAPLPPIVPENAPAYMKDVVAKMIIGEGDTLPVSALPNDGTFPVGTAAWEKRNLAEFVPEWIEEICAQCGNCALVCPHSVIRMKAFDKEHLATAPAAFKTVPLKGREAVTDQVFTLQISVEDCTGCTLCVKACPVEVPDEPGRKCINMVEKAPLLERDKVNWEFFKELPEYDRTAVEADQVRGVQYMEPLFEFSGACAGCGETPYIRMVTQMFGDRALIANATGCSSIFGGNLPTAPWSKNKEGRGTAWCNSLFEDNAEFGFGFRISVDQLQRQANRMLEELTDEVGPDLARAILDAPQSTEAEIIVQRKRVGRLKEILSGMNGAKNGAAAKLLPIADYLIERSIWLIGGDGWAYDIGFGGLDHVLANNRNVNVMVLDTEVYSNTGGQQSKATPRAAVAKFATSGKALGKKDLGMIAMCYGHVYVAQVAFGADAKQTARAIAEAEAHDGPSLIIAYSPCIEHGVDLEENIGHQALAVTSGYWPLYRFDPKLADYGESAMRLDSEKTIPFMDYAITENRFSMLMRTNPDEAEKLIKLAQSDIDQRWHIYQQWAQMGVDQADLAPPMAIV